MGTIFVCIFGMYSFLLQKSFDSLDLSLFKIDLNYN